MCTCVISSMYEACIYILHIITIVIYISVYIFLIIFVKELKNDKTSPIRCWHILPPKHLIQDKVVLFLPLQNMIYIHTVLIVHSIHFKKLNKLHTSFSKPKIQLTCFFKIYYFESLNILSMSGFHAFLLLLVVNTLYILSGAMCILFSFHDINAIFYIRVCCH